MISGQSETEIEALRSYGMDLGIAFQIVDDVLDFRGSEEVLGKPAGNDLREGTVTLPAILFAQSLPHDSHLLGDLREGRDVEELVAAVNNSTAPDVAMERAGEYAGAAIRALSIFPDGGAKDALIQLAEQVVTRDR